VPCRRLDTAISELAVPQPDVIKVDVEGAEALFLRGAACTLHEYSPSLVVELHGAECAREVLKLLGELGYACAGKVSSTIAPNDYARLDPAVAPRVQGLYDVHFLVATRNASDLPPGAWEALATP